MGKNVVLASLCFDRILARRDLFLTNERQVNTFIGQYVHHLHERKISANDIYNALLLNNLVSSVDNAEEYVNNILRSAGDASCVEFYNIFDKSNLFCRICPFCSVDNNQFRDIELELLVFAMFKDKNVEIVSGLEEQGPIFNAIETDSYFQENKDLCVQPEFTLPFTRLFFDEVLVEGKTDEEFISSLGSKYGDSDAVAACASELINELRMRVSVATRTPLTKKKVVKYGQDIHAVFGRTRTFPPVNVSVKKDSFDSQMSVLDISGIDVKPETVAVDDKNTTTDVLDVAKEDIPVIADDVANGEIELVIPDSTPTSPISDDEDFLKLSFSSSEPCETETNVAETDSIPEDNIKNVSEDTLDNCEYELELQSKKRARKKKARLSEQQKSESEQMAKKENTYKHKPCSIFVVESVKDIDGVINLASDIQHLGAFENGILTDNYIACEYMVNPDGDFLFFYVKSLNKYFTMPVDFNIGMELLLPYFKRKRFRVYTGMPYKLVNELFIRYGIIPRSLYSVYTMYKCVYPESDVYSLTSITEQTTFSKINNGDNALAFCVSRYDKTVEFLLSEGDRNSVMELIKRELNCDLAYGISLNKHMYAGGGNLLVEDKSGHISLSDETVIKNENGIYFAYQIKLSKAGSKSYGEVEIIKNVISRYVDSGRIRTCPFVILSVKTNMLQLYVADERAYDFVYEMLCSYTQDECMDKKIGCELGLLKM